MDDSALKDMSRKVREVRAASSLGTGPNKPFPWASNDLTGVNHNMQQPTVDLGTNKAAVANGGSRHQQGSSNGGPACDDVH